MIVKPKSYGIFGIINLLKGRAFCASYIYILAPKLLNTAMAPAPTTTMTGSDDGSRFHDVGACILRALGATRADLSAPGGNLVVADCDDSMDMDGPTVYDVQASGKRYRLAKRLEGMVGERMSARSFWYGLGNRRGFELVVRPLPADAAAAEEARDGGTPVLVVVRAQCGAFDVRECKEDRDARPTRALNALARYCDSTFLPEPCRPHCHLKALKALAKRPLTPKDLGLAAPAASGRTGAKKRPRKTAKKAGKTVAKKRAAEARKRP